MDAGQAVLMLEKNCRFEPLRQKLGRLKRDCTDIGTLMNALVKYADSDNTKDPEFDEEKTGKGKKNGNGKGHQHNPAGGGKRKAEGNPEFVANTNAQGGNQRRKGKPFQRSGGSGPSLEQLLNEPCPKHGTREKPATHLWKDCAIMKAFKNYNPFDGGHGPGGGSGSGNFHGPGGGSNSGFQGNQQSGQGNQQQQSGYQSQPKQLNGGQYHVFTTSLCKRDLKVRKRVVNSVEPAVPRYLRWTEQPIVWSREDHPPRVDNPG